MNLRRRCNKVIRRENLYFFLSITDYRELGFRIYKNTFFVVTKRFIQLVIFWWYSTRTSVLDDAKRETSDHVFFYVCNLCGTSKPVIVAFSWFVEFL